MNTINKTAYMIISSFVLTASADGMPDDFNSTRFRNHKSNRPFSVSVSAGVNVSNLEHISRAAIPTDGSLDTLNQPKKNSISHLGELQGDYTFPEYPISLGVSYTFFGKNKYKASPVYIQMGAQAARRYLREFSAHNLGAHVKYHLKKVGSVEPFLGLGLGVARYKVNTKTYVHPSSTPIFYQSNKGSTMTQSVLLGADYKMSKGISLNSQLKYTHFNKMRDSKKKSANSYKVSGSHNFGLLLGLKFKF
jgi:opacity protein-like surface antigen